MYYIAICDDDLYYADYLEKLIYSSQLIDSSNLTIFKYPSGEDLVKSLDNNIPFNLLILDMQMKQMDGDETANCFRKKYPDAVLVFCSGICQPTVKSFEVNAFRYLLKEYDENKMMTEFESIITEMKKRDSSPVVEVRSNGKKSYISASNIMYAGIRKHGCDVFVINRSDMTVTNCVCSKSLAELYADISSAAFAYAHNSYFVNLSDICSISKHELELSDGTKLSISRSKEKALHESMATLLATKYL